MLTTRLQLVEVLEELRDVLVQIDNETVDRRYVDFAALASRLEGCIDELAKLPATATPTDEQRPEYRA